MTRNEKRLKQFACGDVVPGCDAQFVSSDEDDIMAQVASHAASAHGMAEVPGELAAQVRSLIVTV